MITATIFNAETGQFETGAAVASPVVVPSSDPVDYPLLPWQFEAMVNYLGVDAQIRAAIAQIPDAMKRSAALSRYQKASAYHYDDALLQSMRAAIGMSNETFTDAWMQAKDLTSGA